MTRLIKISMVCLLTMTLLSGCSKISKKGDSSIDTQSQTKTTSDSDDSDGVIELPDTKVRPQLVTTKHSSDAYIVAEENVKYYDAVGDGESDDTHAFHAAITAVKEKGGGVVYVPDGTYKITQSIEIPIGVTLYGDFSEPDDKRIKGTLLKIYTPTEAEGNTTAAFQMQGGSAMKGLVIWYPEQTLKDGKATAYPYTIEMMEQQGITLEHIFLVNSYKGIKMGPNTNALETLRFIYGTTLDMGIYIDNNVDIARIENINLSIDWWLNSGLPGTPNKNELFKWMINASTAIRIEKVDWGYISDFTVKGYKIGVHTARSSNGASNSHLYNLNITDCNTGIFIEDSNYYGYLITNSVIKATAGNNPAALRLAKTFANNVSVLNSELVSSGFYLVEMNGTGSVTLQDCTMITTANEAKYGICATDGMIAVSNVKFTGEGKFAYFGEAVKQANLVGCMTKDTLKVDNAGKVETLKINFDSANKAVDMTQPVTGYAPLVRKPGTAQLFNAADYGVVPENNTDMSSNLQKAIDAAAAVGGGTVYVPYGLYRLDNKITVKSGVEVLGSLPNPHHTKNSCTTFLTDYGKNDANGDALFTLQANSGLRGFTVFYDKQDSGNLVPYAYTIRGDGSHISVVGVTLSYTFQGIDFKTNRCDNHYIEGVGFGALKNGIAVGGGSKNGVVRDVQSNIHFTAGHKLPGANRDKPVLLEYALNNLQGFIVSDTTDQTMINNFIYGAFHGIAVIDQADAYIIGHGTDSGTKCVYMNNGEGKTVTFVNTQLVPLGEGDKNQIMTDTGYKGTVNFFNTNFWGKPIDGIVVNGGTVNIVSGTSFQGGKSTVLLKGGKATVSGLYFCKRSLADFNIEAGATGFKAFGNTFNSSKSIINNSELTLQGSDCSE